MLGRKDPFFPVVLFSLFFFSLTNLIIMLYNSLHCTFSLVIDISNSLIISASPIWSLIIKKFYAVWLCSLLGSLKKEKKGEGGREKFSFYTFFRKTLINWYFWHIPLWSGWGSTWVLMRNLGAILLNLCGYYMSMCFKIEALKDERASKFYYSLF